MEQLPYEAERNTNKNFRGIRSIHLPLDGLTVLIGENNTGKSTVLEAIRLVLTRGFGIRGRPVHRIRFSSERHNRHATDSRSDFDHPAFR
jgi:predicted ATP-binding protein involved in virulence